MIANFWCYFATIVTVSMAVSPTLFASAENPEAIEELRTGVRSVANAAWWGFNEEDATEALQAAINSSARRVIVPNMKRDWIVRPIQLAGDQELILEKGVVITAKRGEYRGKGDSVFRARDVSNLTVRGYGATVRMQKEDYIVGKVLLDLDWHRWFDQYEKAEWRMTLSLNGCTNVNVYGLTLKDSGGDGIYIAGGKEKRPCRNIHIKDVVCDNHYRQGISIISVDGLLVENSVFKNTWGTPPSAGVDIEPDSPEEIVKDIVFRDCDFTDNYGDGIQAHLAHQRNTSAEVSILFENCRVSSRRGSGIRVTKVADDGPAGRIEFRGCVVEDTEGYGIKIQDKSADRARVRFIDCTVRNAANNRRYEGAWAPIWLHSFRSKQTQKFGGIDFVDCRIGDDQDRPIILLEESEGEFGVFDLTGTISASNPFGVKTDLGRKQQGVSLIVNPVAQESKLSPSSAKDRVRRHSDQ
ncbi:MAG: right-handed parallel beta-helix repeat-containing protein [Candidatus Hydrogenedentes bacterium]|nr:right-handed parallel beta-helix repeat-containing protein [Candidatus Hydrogenedentota bacterium]